MHFCRAGPESSCMSHPARSQTQGPGKTAPARLQNLRQVPHRNGATRTRFQLLYLLHALEDMKLFLQFRSDFKDARRDVTTKHASPHVSTTRAAAPRLMHPCPFIRSAPAQQTLGFTDVTIAACTLTGKDTHREKRSS